MKYIGAHVSIAGGVENAPLNAAAIGATAFAMFTKNQRQWSAPPLEASSATAFKENCQIHHFPPELILPHDSYLINLGQADPEKLKLSRESFVGEMKRVAGLGLCKLNFHPGSHLGLMSEKECLDLIAAGVRQAVDEVPGVMAVIENTAGQGTNLGYAFEQLGYLVKTIDRPGRVGVCFDTCHAYAAGYDLATPEGYDWTMKQFAAHVGFNLLAGMHLNDSKSKLNGRLDRHHSIGQGELGEATFQRLMADPRLDDIPLVLETIDETLWPAEIARLKSYCR
ncbi:MAG: deoxyribonuclease IV [Victivallaceae bacterium]